MSWSPGKPPAESAERAARQNRFGHDLRGKRADGRRRCADRAGRQGEDRVAIQHRVSRPDGPRQTIVRHLGDLGGLRFAKPRIRGDNADHRVGLHCKSQGVAANYGLHQLQGVREVTAAAHAKWAHSTRPEARDDLPRPRIDHITERIHCHNRPHHEPANFHAGTAEPGFHRQSHAK